MNKFKVKIQITRYLVELMKVSSGYDFTRVAGSMHYPKHINTQMLESCSKNEAFMEDSKIQ